MANTNFQTRIPADLLTVVDDHWRRIGYTSRNEYIIVLMRDAVGEVEPATVNGWIAIDRPGEKANDCPECGQGMHDPHIGIMSDGRLTDILCGDCAQSPQD